MPSAQRLYKYLNPKKLEWFLQYGILLTPPKFFKDGTEFAFQQEPENLGFPHNPAFEQWQKGPLYKEQCASNYREKISDVVGVISLTADDNSDRMWREYADAYQGAIIEFGVDFEILHRSGFNARSTKLGPAFEVQYEAARLILDKVKLRDSNQKVNEMIRMCCTKDREVYIFEKEWRIVRKLENAKHFIEKRDKYYFLETPRDAVTGILYTNKMEVSLKTKLFCSHGALCREIRVTK